MTSQLSATIGWRILLLVLALNVAPYVTAGQPNIIFLLADDQTFDSLGCYGNHAVKTPHIDRLASEGLTFDHYYNTTAICMASRANILTGMYEYKTGCNFGAGDLPAKHFANSYPVLLRKAGYLTAIAGKIGVEVEGSGLPVDAFDWWGAGPGQTHYETAKNDSMAKYADKFPHSTAAYGAFGADFVKWSTKQRKPFCLSISFKAPHRPVSPDPQYDDVYKDTQFPKPANYGRKNGDHFSEQSRRGRQYPRFESWGYKYKYNETVAKYHQQIYGIDQAVARIRKAVEAAGAASNTVIIYTSDNGFFNGAHGYGSKVLPYEESSRAPMIFHDPRNPQSHGKRTQSITGNIDVAPTILALAELGVPDQMDGRSLIPLLNDQRESIHDHIAIMNCWGPKPTHSLGVVTDQLKYIYWSYESEEMQPTEELYNLSTDRLEMHNLAKSESHRDDLANVRAIYDTYVQHIGESAERPSYKKYAETFAR